MLAVQLSEPNHPVFGFNSVQVPDEGITGIGGTQRQTAVLQAIGSLLQKAFLRRYRVKFVVFRH